MPNVSSKEDFKPCPFCNLAKYRPKPNFNPFRDILLKDIVFFYLSYKHHLPAWLGRVLTCTDLSNGPNYGIFIVEWWTPMKGFKRKEREHLQGNAGQSNSLQSSLFHRKSIAIASCTLTTCFSIRQRAYQKHF
jgi:hypothetical protein